MKILQLTPRFPFPSDDGGKIGIANIFKQFSSQGADVTLFSLNHELLANSALSNAKQYGEVILLNYNTKNTPIKIAKSLFTNTSIFIEKYKHHKIFQFIDNLVQANHFDIIHADHTCMGTIAAYIKDKYHIPFGLRLHNIEYKIWERYAKDTKNFGIKFYITNQAKLLKKAEIRLIEKADINFAITDNDRNEVIKISPNAKVITASAGVDIDEWKPAEFSQREPEHLVIATTYNWIHNVNALRWFLERVLLRLHYENPKVKISIIGKNPPQWINNFNNFGANIVGYLDDIKPFMRECGIYIAPLFVGSGIRIKILEAMAMELPVVATSISAEGINASSQDGLFIADNEQEYVNIILQLMTNHELRKQSGFNARQFIMENFSWQKNIFKMLAEYQQLLA